MKRLTFLLVALAGCESPPAKLEYRAIGVVEGAVPMGVVIKIENTGGQTGLVDTVRANILQSKVIATDESVSDDVAIAMALYDGPDPDGVLPNVGKGQAIEVPAGELADLRCDVAWGLAEPRQAMLALVRVEFVASFQGRDLLRSKPRTIVLQSLPGVLEQVLRVPLDDPAQGATIVRIIDRLGEPLSDGAKMLREHMAAGSETY